MEYKPKEEENFEYFYNIVCAHKSSSCGKPLSAIIPEQAKIYSQMHQQERY